METEKEQKRTIPAALKRKRWIRLAAVYGIGSAVFVIGTVAGNLYWAGTKSLPVFWGVVYTFWFFTELVAALIIHLCEEDSEDEQ